MELHDNINQLLASANLYLGNIHLPAERDKTRLKKAAEIIRSAIREIRKISASLVPPALQFESLKDSIKHFVSNLELTDIKFIFEINIDEAVLPTGLKLSIYRIIQEQVSNIIKYAAATEVHILLKQSAAKIILEIIDNGKGFNPNERSKGIGLANITYRAEAYNGSVNIETGPGSGCRISVEFMLSLPGELPK